MSNLDNNLYSKISLKFNQDGRFKILMLSDIQETLEYDKRTLEGINKIIEHTNPDLVVLGGDNCDGTVIKTEKELKKYLDIFSEYLEANFGLVNRVPKQLFFYPFAELHLLLK